MREEPRLERDEEECWVFYCQNVRPFVRDFGLMGERIRRTGLEGVELEIFEERLAVIYEKMMEISGKRRGGGGYGGGGGVAVAEEPT